MISGKNHPIRLSDSDPTGRFECLCGFIDEQCTETSAGQYPVIAADQCGGYDPCRREQVLIDEYFQFRSTVTKATDTVAG